MVNQIIGKYGNNGKLTREEFRAFVKDSIGNFGEKTNQEDFTDTAFKRMFTDLDIDDKEKEMLTSEVDDTKAKGKSIDNFSAIYSAEVFQ